MSRRTLFSLACGRVAACLLPLTALGHDFWIEPSRFRAATGDEISIRFLIGDPGAVEHWETEWRKVVSLQDYTPAKVIDRLATLRPQNGVLATLEQIDASMPMNLPGTHIIAFSSNQAVNDLSAEQFNAYAEHEGLAMVLADRRRTGRGESRGRELYSRRAKALIQIGSRPSDTVSRPIGQTLEIVPELNPYRLKSGDPLNLQIWFHGLPLAGASVVLEKLGEGAEHGTPALSDPQGRVSFPYTATGAWKVNVVWSYPISDPRADYETIFCSMTYGAH